MDRNQLIGLALISVMLIAYAQFFAPKPSVQPTHTKANKKPKVKTHSGAKKRFGLTGTGKIKLTSLFFKGISQAILS